MTPMTTLEHWNPEDRGFWDRAGRAVAQRNLWVSIPALALAFAVWMLWSVVVASFMGWTAWGWINAVRGVARSAPLQYLIPPSAGLFAWLLAGETFTWIKVAGGGLTLLGVALAQYAGRLRR